MSIREILLQLAALVIGFIGGLLCMRDNYIGLIRSLRATIKEYERRA